MAGMSHCGSSYAAQVLRLSGCNFGTGEQLKSPTAPHGMELHSFLKFFGPLEATMGYSSDEPYSWGDIRRRTADPTWRHRMLALSKTTPPFVKANWMMRWLPMWMESGALPPRGVIICTRSVEAMHKSVRRVYKKIYQSEVDIRASYGYFLETLSHYDIPFTVLDFPRSAKDPEYFYRTVKPLMVQVDQKMPKEKLLRAHEGVTKLSWIHA